MNNNFSAAIGNLLAHFYKCHHIALTEPEIWLINNMLYCTDEHFHPMEAIADIIGITLCKADIRALMEYEWNLTIWDSTRIYENSIGRFCRN